MMVDNTQTVGRGRGVLSVLIVSEVLYVFSQFVGIFEHPYIGDLCFLFICSFLVCIVTIIIVSSLKKWSSNGFLLGVVLVPFILFYERFHSIIAYYATPLSRIRYVLPTYSLMILFISIIILRVESKRLIKKLSFYLLCVFLVLAVFSLFGVSSKNPIKYDRPVGMTGGGHPIVSVSINYSPDIYYIVLDSYTSSENLKKYWQFDNNEFESEITNLGFSIAHNSKTFYYATQVSIDSSLNMTNDRKLLSMSRSAIFADINQSCVVSALQARGYRTINYSLFKIAGVDRYYDFFEDKSAVTWGAFVVLAASESIVGGVISAIRYFSADIGKMNLDIFNRIPQVRQSLGTDNSPLFTYAHIMCPHGPYCFDSNGALIPYFSRKLFSESAYLEQVKGTNRLVLDCVQKILSNYSENRKPIIIVQGDHGYRYLSNANDKNDERWGIFNAFYLPGGGNINIYKDVSPYNSFRIIEDTYFNASLDLLPD